MIDPEYPSEEDLELMRNAMAREVERREFLNKACRLAGGALLATSLGTLASCGSKTATTTTQTTVTSEPTISTGTGSLAIASGDNPGELTRKAVDALGGMGGFVNQGNVVLVKPNASFLNGIRNTATTDPDVVGEVVAMCSEAGASRIIVLDHVLCGSSDDGFGSGSGIGEAAEKNGAEIIGYDTSDTGGGVDTEITGGKSMKSASIYPEVFEADVIITVPKAKHHHSAGLSLGMKNFIGVQSNPTKTHNYDLQQAIADLNTVIRPTLSVIDASVILLTNGPRGPGQTQNTGQIIASPDVVAADSYACTLFGLTADNVPHIVYGAEAGLGTIDYETLNLVRV